MTKMGISDDSKVYMTPEKLNTVYKRIHAI